MVTIKITATCDQCEAVTELREDESIGAQTNESYWKCSCCEDQEICEECMDQCEKCTNSVCKYCLKDNGQCCSCNEEGCDQ